MRPISFQPFCVRAVTSFFLICPLAADAFAYDSRVAAQIRAVGHPTFASPHVRPITVISERAFVVNTPADTVDVFDANSRKLIRRIPVGIDPVSIAIRPDGKEAWVSNHVSDSVSVIDIDRTSATDLVVVATVQQFDRKSRSTSFDEPVGIAFANNEKAYVALSSENTVAVVDVDSRRVIKRLKIPAQDPRAIVVRGDRLYVAPFESNNKTQLSGGTPPLDGDLVTFDAWQHSIIHNNVLSLGHVIDIVKHPRVPDRDLFVFDIETDQLVETVDGLGTLLYGIAVDSEGTVFITQTDARNDVNGRSGTKKHGLTELENRAFLNRITQIGSSLNSADVSFMDLEPLPPQQPKRDEAVATPYAIEISDDDATLFISAAGSDQLVTVDAKSGEILGRTDVDAVPRGIALVSDEDGKPLQAWVFNAVENTISVIDVKSPSQPILTGTVVLDDPTDPLLKQGRKMFETASVSSTGTFSCSSCHPNGHTDQLLWVLKTPIVSGGDQIMPRSTMPVRGLRDTAPFHWDGIPGDPYGGNNSASIHTLVPANSDASDPLSSIRHLIDGGIAGTMSLVGDDIQNDEGKAGRMSAKDRDAMAAFLLSIPYPPAQRRAYTNVVSERAIEGFRLFHIDGDHDEKPRPNVCGNCHRMPFLVSTNTPGTGMDAPTWRGAYDRFLILPQGRLNIIDFDFYARIADAGQNERDIWRMSWGGRPRFDPVWDMVLEGSTGFSGAFARQWTLNRQTADEELTRDLIGAMEQAARDGSVALEVDGVVLASANTNPIHLQFVSTANGGRYVDKSNTEVAYDRFELFDAAANGKFIGTATARHGAAVDHSTPQPALWTLGPIERQSGRQKFPIVHDRGQSLILSGRHVGPDARVYVDGRLVAANVEIESERLAIALNELPSTGMHLLQVQNRKGRFSNDFIFHVAESERAALELQAELDQPHIDLQSELTAAISSGDLSAVKRLITRGASVDDQDDRSGSTPLATASLHGHREIASELLSAGANVNATNRDGNTPLHVAAFMCHQEIIELLVKHDASLLIRSKRGQRPVDVVSGEWSNELAELYRFVGGVISKELDLQDLQEARPMIAQLLVSHSQIKLDKP